MDIPSCTKVNNFIVFNNYMLSHELIPMEFQVCLSVLSIICFASQASERAMTGLCLSRENSNFTESVYI